MQSRDYVSIGPEAQKAKEDDALSRAVEKLTQRRADEDFVSEYNLSTCHRESCSLRVGWFIIRPIIRKIKGARIDPGQKYEEEFKGYAQDVVKRAPDERKMHVLLVALVYIYRATPGESYVSNAKNAFHIFFAGAFILATKVC